MTDIVERLNVIRDHLRTGRFGQREVWEEWLTEAAADLAILKRHYNLHPDAPLSREETIAAKDAEIARLRGIELYWKVEMDLAVKEIERLRSLESKP